MSLTTSAGMLAATLLVAATSAGHLAMWEYPELFAAELRAAFKPLR